MAGRAERHRLARLLVADGGGDAQRLRARSLASQVGHWSAGRDVAASWERLSPGWRPPKI